MSDGSLHSGRPPAVIALGELLIDLLPASVVGGPAQAPAATSGFVRAAGGAPANVAVALAKLGTPSAFLGAVGNDPFGRFLIDELVANGVFTDAIVEVPQLTAVAFVVLGEGGERDFLFYREGAAHDRLQVRHVDTAFALPALAAAKVLHIGSNSFAVEPQAAAARHALAVAERSGMTVSFDVNYRAAFWPDAVTAKRTIRQVLPSAGIVKLSLEELAFLQQDNSRAGAERFAAALLAGRARLVCVTLGAQGAWYFSAAVDGTVKAPQVVSVDTTGAGDAFVAALLAQEIADATRWNDEVAAREAVGRACAYAALSTTRSGAIASYADAPGFERFIAENGATW